jgi:small redox-active disulfide protein 2
MERNMRSIKVLGSCCSKCATTAKLIEQVAAERGVPIDLEKVEDVERIVGYGVMSTPAVVVDGKVAIAGAVPDRAAIARWLGSEPQRTCCA